MNEHDPTGYYARKDKQRMQYFDEVLFPFYKYGAIACLIVLAAKALLN